jgi:hypothetical protein
MNGGVICGNRGNCLFLKFGPFVAFEVTENKMELYLNKRKGCKI